MKRHLVGEDLIRAISVMEKAGDWPIASLLLELAQFRVRASLKQNTEAVEEKKVEV